MKRLSRKVLAEGFLHNNAKLPHGSIIKYKIYGCRCQFCVRAYTEYLAHGGRPGEKTTLEKVRRIYKLATGGKR